jgi:hypothetical protein
MIPKTPEEQSDERTALDPSIKGEEKMKPPRPELVEDPRGLIVDERPQSATYTKR